MDLPFSIINKTLAFISGTLLLASASHAFTLPPEMDNSLLQAMTDLYNLDTDKSDREFQQITGRFPEEPLPHVLYAGSLWWRAAERFQNPAERELLKKQFDAQIAQTISTANAKAARPGSQNDEILFSLGGAYGLSGRWKVLDGHWVKAYHDGTRGERCLREALALNPQLFDADLGLGIYDYYTSTMSGFFKRIAASLLLHGNKERGITELKTAAEQGHFSAVEAKLFLFDFYESDEKNYPEALRIARDLRSRYPDSPLFHYMEIVTLFDTGDHDNCAREAQSFIDKIKTRSGTYAPQQMPLASLFLANVLIQRHNIQGAVNVLSQAISGAPDTPTLWLTFCYLRRGQAEDILGLRDSAIADYRHVLRLPDYRDSYKKTRPFLKAPCTFEQIIASMENQ